MFFIFILHTVPYIFKTKTHPAMLVHLTFSFACSVIFALILTYLLKRRAPGPFNGVLYFFAIIFVFTAGLGVLINPIGPTYKNVPWLAIGAIALLIMLLIAELLPHHEKGMIVKHDPELTEEEKDERTLEREFNLLIGLIFVILIGAIIYVATSSKQIHMSF
jgi:uncharacterized membrane protein YphA (DoxX/SURF4 family)